MAESRSSSPVFHPAGPVIYIGKEATPLVDRAIRFVHDYWQHSKSPVPLPAPEIMEYAQKTNPCTIAVTLDRHGKLLGVVEMYALNKRAMRALLGGKKNEDQLQRDDLEAYDKLQSTWELYVAILCPTEGMSGNQQDLYTLACLVGGMEALTRGYLKLQQNAAYTSPAVNLYGIDATPRGRRLMDSKLGFKKHINLTALRHQKGFEESVWKMCFNLNIAAKLSERYRTSAANFEIKWSI